MADPVVRVLDFEGPLDLLIHLIEKNKMDIYDIPIVSITDQYISYLHSFTETDLEAASQFLVMASLLLQIKSRMLLPKTELEDEDEADPRDMLVQMLLEYRLWRVCPARCGARLRWWTGRSMTWAPRCRRL